MHPFYKIDCANAQEDHATNLADFLAGLSLDYAPVPSATAAQGQADPRWIAILARKAKSAAAHREIARRHGAPGRLPSRTPAAANDDTPAEPIAAVIPVPGLVTKPSHRRQLKSGLRQREDAARMRALDRARKQEAVEHPAPTSFPSLTASNSPASNDNGKRRARGLAAWDDAGELPQLIAVNDALSEFGTAWAWSLNIHPDLIRAGNDNARGILDFLRRRVALSLKRGLGRAVPMWLAIETDDEGRPHLHGGLALNDNDNLDGVRACLERAGGAWSRQGSAPADIRLQWRPIGWAAYPLKRVARTRRDLRESVGLDPDAPVAVWSCTNDLRAAGKAIHVELRRSLDPRSIKIDVTAQTLASTDGAGLALDREPAEAQEDTTVNKHERFHAPRLKENMHPRLITDETAADLLDASTIAHRVHNGAATVILGTHHELGAWSLMQTTTCQFYVTSERDPVDLGAFLAATTPKAA